MAKDDDRMPSAAGDVHGDRHLARAGASGQLPRVVRSDALLAGASQLAILHNDTLYFPSKPRCEKLILTKKPGSKKTRTTPQRRTAQKNNRNPASQPARLALKAQRVPFARQPASI